MNIDFNRSIVESYTYEGIKYLIKRDDLISSEINGNKAYKFYFLLDKDFKNIVSFGGNQSNAMLAISFLAKYKNANFTYFTRALSSYLENNINGNLKIALENGMQLRFYNQQNDFISFAKKNNAIFIPQGGAMSEAEIGIIELGKNIVNLNLEHLCVFYSSGTGTSSLFLQKYLKQYNIDVWTTACVGNKEYLKKQFSNLTNDKSIHPNIIMPKEKFPFAKPHISLLEIYKKWKNIGVEFDLLYDCVMWKAIMDNKNRFQKYKNLLFLHSGGTSGNESQLLRYKYLDMI
ncbi:hypothetical protein CCY99_01415 [Helicobacter sp. 16-1353]|uniref:1-aminocyclopropane-1-carboxylate deaminase/D-cysteine desulfhydrase n=1 Tax=Helicobacter sp. 16-1353 TaxID=2004996 RepID=UPI000DCD99D4|nr:1-aminocyclopropane-1-carboxylate deaminase/D-cysteine desulfhydrase [Helicobacter sp. 16-1353]RAX54842.1 hypothetical protein CCY99_01415 [Helicobacter sp. 16-1353]